MALRSVQRFSIITPQSPLNAQAFLHAREMISRARRLQWTWPSSSTSMMWESAPPPRSPAALFNLPAYYSRCSPARVQFNSSDNLLWLQVHHVQDKRSAGAGVALHACIMRCCLKGMTSSARTWPLRNGFTVGFLGRTGMQRCQKSIACKLLDIFTPHRVVHRAVREINRMYSSSASTSVFSKAALPRRSVKDSRVASSG